MTTINGNGHNCHSSSTTANGGSACLLLTTVKWAVENDLFLSDLVQRCSLPHLALVTKGQHLSVGAPNVANPNLKPYVLVHSKHRLRKVLAQMVKVKEGKGQTLTEHKVSIPESYRGFFEILSEDGRPVRCLESVQELFQKFPELCLVRQNCKGIVPDGDGELRSLYRSRAIVEGEVLTLVGQFNFKRCQFLRCFDEQGKSVYLKMSQKAKFSPIAKSKEAIAGVHTIQNLMTKRLPLTVKLVHQPHHHQNQFPAEMSKSFSGGQLVVRLLSTFREDVVFAYAVHKPDGQFLSVPLNAHLKLAPALNHPQVLTHHEFKDICRSCDELLSTFFDRIALCNDHQLVYDQHQHHHHSSFDTNGCLGGRDETTQAVNGSKNDLDNDAKNAIYGQRDDDDDDQRTEINGNDNQHSTAVAICDDEIDQLYDYIRGLAPLPSTCEPTPPQPHQQVHHSRSKHANNNYRPPPPPPVETIPSRKSTNSFSSPEPRICQSPPETQRQRLRSPSSPPPQSALPSKMRISHCDTNERKPSLSPIPPEPRAKSPPTQFVVELRNRGSSSQHNNASPCSTARPNGNGVSSNAAPPVPEKRLDDVIYGKNALDRLRRLSKSTEKIPGAADDYYASQYLNKPHFLQNFSPTQINGNDRAYAAPRHHYHQQQQHQPQQQHQRKTTPTGAPLPHQYARRVQSKPRPMSMVIPDSAASVFAPPPPPHDLFASPRSFGQTATGDPYQQAYRSFVNLTMLDEPPPPPPPYHSQAGVVQSLRANGTTPPPPQSSYYPTQAYGGNLAGARPVYHQRYTPRYHYQAAYRV